MTAPLIQQVRDAIKSRVTGLASTGSRVFLRGRPLADAQLPALRLRTTGESVRARSPLGYADGAPATVLATGQFEITFVGSIVGGGDVEAIALQSLAEVRAALSADRTLGGLARDLSYSGVDINDDWEGDVPVVVSVFRVNVDYLVSEQDILLAVPAK